ncbi:MAG TPA: hypothetical protein VEI02_13255, partial [Planctomycetota bacterium]|nr:hypothetical protein [Planctomycetota bacterium]
MTDRTSPVEASGERALARAKRYGAFQAFRFLHLFSLAAVALAVGYFVLRYDLVETGPGEAQLAPLVPAGRSLVCVAVDDDLPLGKGVIVEIDGATGPRFSRVAAAPGDVIAFREGVGGRREATVDGRPVDAAFPANAPVPAGVVPPDRFLVVDPNPDVSTDDSRTLGLLPRSRIRRKVIFSGWD